MLVRPVSSVARLVPETGAQAKWLAKRVPVWESRSMFGVAILAGIIPLKSAKMAAWLNGNVPGIRVPEPLIAEMAAAADGDAQLRTGIEIAARTIRAVRNLCAGVHVMALGWESHVPAILQSAGLV